MINTMSFQQPLNSAQLEILQLFAEGINDEELQMLRQILIDFKFSRVTALADKIITSKGWSEQDLAEKAQKMKRTPYKAKKVASQPKTN